jgi:hypothetical protein
MSALAQFAGTVAALLFGLGVQVFGLAFFVRRYAAHLGPLFRVEVIAAETTVPAAVAASAPQPEPVRAATPAPLPETVPAAATASAPPTSEAPTSPTESEAVPAVPLDAGFLRQLFEENLRMQAEVAGLPAD